MTVHALEHQPPKRTTIGESSTVTIGLMVLLVGLAFACGKLWNRVDDLTVQIPASADAARGYTDNQVGRVDVKLDDIITRLDRVEQQLDHFPGRSSP